jgi:hypothetical protein
MYGRSYSWRTSAGIRLAWIGAPRSTMGSRRARTSARVIVCAFRVPQVGRTSRSSRRTSSTPAFFMDFGGTFNVE